MPGRMSRRRRRRRRPRRRALRMGRYPSALSARRVSEGMPPQVRTKLVYEVAYARTAAFTDVYSGTSIFDPEFALGGGQPRYFDQFAAFYTRYYVIASKAIVTVENGASGPQMLALQAVSQNTVSISPNNAAELADTKSVMLAQAISAAPTILTSRKTTDHMFGVDTYSDMTYWSVTTTDPSRQWFWKVAVDSCPTGGTINCNYHLRIEYDVIFAERRLVGAS